MPTITMYESTYLTIIVTLLTCNLRIVALKKANSHYDVWSTALMAAWCEA